MRKIETRYMKYYKHWRDFDMLTTILAVIGLLLAVTEVSKAKILELLFSFYPSDIYLMKNLIYIRFTSY